MMLEATGSGVQEARPAGPRIKASPVSGRGQYLPPACCGVVTGGGSRGGRCAARTRIVLRAATGMATDPRLRSQRRRN